MAKPTTQNVLIKCRLQLWAINTIKIPNKYFIKSNYKDNCIKKNLITFKIVIMKAYL